MRSEGRLAAAPEPHNQVLTQRQQARGLQPDDRGAALDMLVGAARTLRFA
jgi:hypothetical protein